MVEITYQMLQSTLQTVSLMVGVIYYLIIMRNSQKTQQITLETRQAQLTMQIYQELISENNLNNFIEIQNWEWEDYDDFERKYGSDDHPERWAKRFSVIRTFDGIGLLLKDGLLDADRLYDLIRAGTIQLWMKWGPIIKEQRVRYGYPKDQEGVECARADGGRLIIPLGSVLYYQTLTLIEKQGGELKVRYITDVVFVPMIGKARVPAP